MVRSLIPMMVVAMLLSCGSGGPPEQHGPTGDAFVRAFLQTWLVERDLERAGQYVADDFFVHPTMKSTLRDRDHALTYAWNCPNVPRACSSIAACMSGDYEMRTQVVDAKMIESAPELRSREGREVVGVAFKLKGCNLGTLVLMDKDAPDSRRVLTMVYLAG